MSNVKDIWFDPASGNQKLPDELLMAYLEGRLSPEERHRVELWLATEGLESDALEGLQQLPVSDTKESVVAINYQLTQNLKKKKRKRKHFSGNFWSWLAVIIILLLTILAYIIIYLSVKRH